MDVHFIEDNLDIIAFMPETLRFFKVNKFTKDIINDLKDTQNKNYILEKYNLTSNDLDVLINNLEKKESFKDAESNKPTRDNNIKYLDRLVINISNDCNLSCKYCYANEGCYDSEKSYMTINTARLTLETFFTFFDEINNIQIFGGEPLINIPVIKFICEWLEEKHKNNEIRKLPNIGFVSNGVLINEEIINLMKRYNMKATISLDGPPEVNDSMRVFKNGTGISKIVEDNILLMKKETNEPSTIEATYNISHVNQGVSIADVSKYILDKFNTYAHIAPVGGEKGDNYLLNDYEEFVKSVDDIFSTFKTSNPNNYSLVQRMIEGLMKKNLDNNYICAAGLGTLSVSVDGTIYPCFMFTDNSDFSMGKIDEKNLFTSDKFRQIRNNFISMNKNNIEPCNKCFIRKICSGCLGRDYYETGSIKKLSEANCDMQRRMMERVVINLVRLSSKAN